MSKVLSFLYDQFSVLRVPTTAYHPKFNGKLERFHASLKAVLRKCISIRKIGLKY